MAKILTGIIAGSLLIIMFILGALMSNDYYHRQAIEHNCAQYDTQTGEFIWKEEGK